MMEAWLNWRWKRARLRFIRRINQTTRAKEQMDRLQRRLNLL